MEELEDEWKNWGVSRRVRGLETLKRVTEYKNGRLTPRRRFLPWGWAAAASALSSSSSSRAYLNRICQL